MTAIIVHGGAGASEPERHPRLRAGVRAAAAAGDAILGAGGSALDAVTAAVRVLEDDPDFNAGLGSALTRDGTVETDASIMCGATQRIGAVAAVPDLGRAIALARALLDRGEHAMLAGEAAWTFAREAGIPRAAPGALVTAHAKQRLAERGTVGAVARDRAGRFAAATSTGGMTGKRSGRVGDSPIIGAGTWADARVAISATGDGEAIMRVALARSIAARSAGSLDEAVRAELEELARITGGSAGVIAVDRDGVVGLQLSPSMAIAWVDHASGAADSMGYRVPGYL
jgi:beta-aspartyl-peptidase (threonine type)